AAWLQEAGADVGCVDLTRGNLHDDQIHGADVVGFFLPMPPATPLPLPMHPAARRPLPVMYRVRALKPAARLIAYGLYAPLNEKLLRERGVTDVLGGEFEPGLVERARVD